MQLKAMCAAYCVVVQLKAARDASLIAIACDASLIAVAATRAIAVAYAQSFALQRLSVDRPSAYAMSSSLLLSGLSGLAMSSSLL